MVNRRYFLVLIAFLVSVVLNSQQVYSLSLGISPGTLNLGDVSPRSNKLIEFYLISNYGRDIVVYLKPEPVTSDFFNPLTPRTHYFNCSASSEENVIGWIEFLENPVVVPATKKTFIVGGKNVIANKKVSAVLHVPINADPGYHAARIRLNPREASKTAGELGMGLRAVVDFTFIFNVPGKAIRSGYILGFFSRRIGNDEIIDIIFKNNGTTSTRARGSVNVYEDDGDVMKTMRITPELVRPNEIRVLHAYWDVRNVELGKYNVSALISWTTGDDYSEGEIEVIAPAIPVVGEVVAPTEFPYWTIVLVLVVLVLVFYWRKK